MLEGLELPIGSIKETLAINAFKDKQQTKYIETLLIVNTIIEVGNRIAAAVTNNQHNGSNTLKELLDTYKELLIPEFSEEKDRKAKRFKEIMERENSSGPFQVEAMAYETRSKKGLN